MANIRFPILHVPFQDPTMTKEAIVERLRLHKRSLMARKQGYRPKLKPDGTPDEQAWKTLMTDFPVPWEYGKRIERWARIISQRHEVAKVLGVSLCSFNGLDRAPTPRQWQALIP